MCDHGITLVLLIFFTILLPRTQASGYDYNGGVSLRYPNTTCPSGSFYEGTSLEANCCPNGQYAAPEGSGYCCPSDVDCVDTVTYYQKCADPSWQQCNWVGATKYGWCCLAGWTCWGTSEGVGCQPPGQALASGETLIAVTLAHAGPGQTVVSTTPSPHTSTVAPVSTTTTTAGVTNPPSLKHASTSSKSATSSKHVSTSSKQPSTSSREHAGFTSKHSTMDSASSSLAAGSSSSSSSSHKSASTGIGAKAGASPGSTSSSPKSSSTNIGAIAGGVVGGIVAIVLVSAAVAYLLYRQRKRRRNWGPFANSEKRSRPNYWYSRTGGEKSELPGNTWSHELDGDANRKLPGEVCLHELSDTDAAKSELHGGSWPRELGSNAQPHELPGARWD